MKSVLFAAVVVACCSFADTSQANTILIKEVYKPTSMKSISLVREVFLPRQTTVRVNSVNILPRETSVIAVSAPSECSCGESCDCGEDCPCRAINRVATVSAITARQTRVVKQTTVRIKHHHRR